MHLSPLVSLLSQKYAAVIVLAFGGGPAQGVQGPPPSPEYSPTIISESSPSFDMLSIILVLGAIGMVVWWFIKRRKAQGGQLSPQIFGTQGIRAQANEPSDMSANPTPARAVAKPSQSAKNLGSIFISYRRDDTSDVTGRIYDRLIQHFGRHAVFKDVDNIPLGVDFRKHLGNSVGKCDVLLTIIGRQWLAGEKGKRGLDNIRDYVRIEIEAALQRDIPVVPVLVQGTSVPNTEELPEVLQSLAYRNGIPVRSDPDFHQDMDRLIKGIEGYLKDKPGTGQLKMEG